MLRALGSFLLFLLLNDVNSSQLVQTARGARCIAAGVARFREAVSCMRKPGRKNAVKCCPLEKLGLQVIVIDSAGRGRYDGVCVSEAATSVCGRAPVRELFCGLCTHSMPRRPQQNTRKAHEIECERKRVLFPLLLKIMLSIISFKIKY